MGYDEIFDDTVPQRAVMVTRTSRYLLPVAADATLDDIAGLPTDDLLVEHAPYVETVSVGEAAADDVLTFTASQMFPSRPLLDAASRLLPAGDGDTRGRIGDEADAILARRRGAAA